MTTKSETLKEDRPARKPYERPRLDVYGDIREMTVAVNMTGPDADGTVHGQTKSG
jgi:hypothetical protein